MVNCNPETVSTDYDTADRLYFEPLTFEDVLEVYYAESASGAGGPGVVGVIVQLGGQTPLGLAQRLGRRRRADRRHQPEGDRPGRGPRRVRRGAASNAGLPAPRFGMATSFEQARRIAADIGYPVLVRPSYVLGGRGMEIVYDDETLRGYITRATQLSPEHPGARRPVPRGRHRDRRRRAVRRHRGVHRRRDGAHRGGRHPLRRLGVRAAARHAGPPGHRAVRRATEAIAHGIGVVGLLNVQYALKDDVLYVLEANPRASRTVPFVSKATAVPLAKACARIMLGATIASAARRGRARRDGRRRQRRAERADRGQGGGAAVQPVPQGRRLAGGFAARTRDEVDGRGDGHRPRLRYAPSPRARPRPTVRCPPRARCSSRWPTATSARWCSPSSGWPTSASACWPPRAPRRCCAATAFRATPCASTSRSRADGRRRSAVDADPRRRGRHGDQHAVRQLRARASTATRSARPPWR